MLAVCVRYESSGGMFQGCTTACRNNHCTTIAAVNTPGENVSVYVVNNSQGWKAKNSHRCRHSVRIPQPLAECRALLSAGRIHFYLGSLLADTRCILGLPHLADFPSFLSLTLPQIAPRAFVLARFEFLLVSEDREDQVSRGSRLVTSPKDWRWQGP